ncbi:zinc finger CCHC domain-containing protein 10-like [Cryptotermes secundus]|uniref:zinc finger CCHC domain-containing protein 10-like n=1 Tax=Cryptotermes secundus TaxID=105785 RepID=UPI000CD7B118|nr:zinc finger CCHC domain-containing protein 10-like [Cryptotermes secundus]
MSAYTDHGKTTSAKKNSGRKATLTERERSSCIENDCFEKSQNYCSTGDRTAALNIRFEDTISTKTVRRKLHKPNNHGRAAIAKPLITESNAQMSKRWCHDHKSWTPDMRKRARDIVSSTTCGFCGGGGSSSSSSKSSSKGSRSGSSGSSNSSRSSSSVCGGSSNSSSSSSSSSCGCGSSNSNSSCCDSSNSSTSGSSNGSCGYGCVRCIITAEDLAFLISDLEEVSGQLHASVKRNISGCVTSA